MARIAAGDAAAFAELFRRRQGDVYPSSGGRVTGGAVGAATLGGSLGDLSASTTGGNVQAGRDC